MSDQEKEHKLAQGYPTRQNGCWSPRERLWRGWQGRHHSHQWVHEPISCPWGSMVEENLCSLICSAVGGNAFSPLFGLMIKIFSLKCVMCHRCPSPCSCQLGLLKCAPCGPNLEKPRQLQDIVACRLDVGGVLHQQSKGSTGFLCTYGCKSTCGCLIFNPCMV